MAAASKVPLNLALPASCGHVEEGHSVDVDERAMTIQIGKSVCAGQVACGQVADGGRVKGAAELGLAGQLRTR